MYFSIKAPEKEPKVSFSPLVLNSPRFDDDDRIGYDLHHAYREYEWYAYNDISQNDQ